MKRALSRSWWRGTGNLRNIDRVAFDHVFENRTVIDIARRPRPQILHARVVALHDVDLALVFKRQAERKRDAFDRGKLPVERPEALAIAGHVIEQNGACGAAAFFGEPMRDVA